MQKTLNQYGSAIHYSHKVNLLRVPQASTKQMRIVSLETGKTVSYNYVFEKVATNGQLQ